MARNFALRTVAPSFVVEGISVYYAGVLEEAFFGKDYYWTSDMDVREAAVKAWMKRHGAHYYGEERWSYDDEGHLNGRGFSVGKGLDQARRFGARVLIVEDLS